jgi:hypothetical protein
MSWQDDIGGGFAYQTAPFAVHPNDSDRAFALIAELRKTDVTWSEVETVTRRYLNGQGVSDEGFITEQLSRVEAHFRPWLRW